jgi:hypothetical protein
MGGKGGGKGVRERGRERGEGKGGGKGGGETRSRPVCGKQGLSWIYLLKWVVQLFTFTVDKGPIHTKKYFLLVYNFSEGSGFRVICLRQGFILNPFLPITVEHLSFLLQVITFWILK